MGSTGPPPADDHEAPRTDDEALRIDDLMVTRTDDEAPRTDDHEAPRTDDDEALHADDEAPHGDDNEAPHTRTPLVDEGTVAIALYEYVFSVDPRGAYV